MFTDTCFYLCEKCLESLLNELFFSWSAGHKEMAAIQRGGSGPASFQPVSFGNFSFLPEYPEVPAPRRTQTVLGQDLAAWWDIGASCVLLCHLT